MQIKTDDKVTLSTTTNHRNPIAGVLLPAPAIACYCYHHGRASLTWSNCPGQDSDGVQV